MNEYDPLTLGPWISGPDTHKMLPKLIGLRNEERVKMISPIFHFWPAGDWTSSATLWLICYSSPSRQAAPSLYLKSQFITSAHILKFFLRNHYTHLKIYILNYCKECKPSLLLPPPIPPLTQSSAQGSSTGFLTSNWSLTFSRLPTLIHLILHMPSVLSHPQWHLPQQLYSASSLWFL